MDYPITDISCILNPKVLGESVPVGHQVAPLRKPVVSKVFSKVYQHRGLYPTGVTDPLFCTPFLCNEESKFVIRKLQIDELLEVADTPPLLYGKLSIASRRHVYAMIAIPIKILAAVVTSIVSLTGLCVGADSSGIYLWLRIRCV